MLLLFIKGLMIGFAIAAAVGPIGVLCIQRSLCDGFKMGLSTGFGAALADGTYGLIAGFGLTSLSSLLVAQQFWIRLIGGIFLIYLGITTFFTKDKETKKDKLSFSTWHALSTTYFLTLTNPVTILSFVAIFAGLGLGTSNNSYADAITLVLGITLGSALWWLFLSSFITFFLHRRLSPGMMRTINKLSGGIIFTFGIYALLTR